jgi:CelD/BcsL family acetyltransferase involved in cellulose biosynthesis
VTVELSIASPRDAASPGDQAATPAIDLREVRTLAELPAVRGDLDELRGRARCAPPNTSPDRFAAIVAALGAGVQPYVAVFRRSGRPCGAIVGRLTRRTNTHRVGYLKLRGPRLRCLDVVYGGLLADADEAAQSAVARRLAALLLGGDVQQIWINHVASDEPLLRSLLGAAGVASRITEAGEHPHWVLDLAPDGFEETLTRFGSKTRKTLRREARRLEERFGGNVAFEVLRGPDALDEIFARASRISARTYHGGVAERFADTPLWRAILTHEASRDALRGYFLMAGGVPIAYYLGAVYSGAMVLEATGYLPEHAALSPGKALLIRLIQSCCAEGLALVDYGFGPAEYKRVYGSRHWPERVLRFRGRGAAASLDAALGSAADGLRRLAASTGDWLGARGRVKRAWRAWFTRRAGACPAPRSDQEAES